MSVKILDIYQFSYFSKLRICYNSFRKYPTQIEIRDGIIESSKGFFGIIIPISFIGIAFANYWGIYLYDMSNNLPNIYIALLSALTLIIGAAYTLWMIKRVIFGAVTNEKINSQSDMKLMEAIPLSLIAILILLIGVWPKPLTDTMNSTILALSYLVSG